MIVVTGLIRSGTSAIAKMLHQGGIVMGSTQLMPVLVMHEWEDAALQRPLGTWLITQEIPARKTRVEFFHDYIVTRRAEYQKTVARYQPGVLAGWGFKTPFVAPFLADLERAAHGLKEPLQIVLTERAYAETMKSIEVFVSKLRDRYRDVFYDNMERVQTEISEALRDRREPRIPIQDVWLRPKRVASTLAARLEINVDTDAMVKGIGKMYV